MNRVKKFLCTMDAGNAAFVIVVGSLYLVCAVLMGWTKFIGAILLGLLLCGSFFGVGVGIYKAIKYAQSKCKEVG